MWGCGLPWLELRVGGGLGGVKQNSARLCQACLWDSWPPPPASGCGVVMASGQPCGKAERWLCPQGDLLSTEEHRPRTSQPQ